MHLRDPSTILGFLDVSWEYAVEKDKIPTDINSTQLFSNILNQMLKYYKDTDGVRYNCFPFIHF